MATSSLASRWKEIHGSNNWDGLLQPLDPELRAEVIRYGEFAEALYDGLDQDDESKFRYFAVYGKSELLPKIGLGLKKGYTITRYLYSTQDTSGVLQLFFGSTESIWMGYVAVSDDEESKRLGRRDVIVAFRGTSRSIEWIFDIRFLLVPFAKLDGGTDGAPAVHRGFLSLYNSSTDANGPFGARSLRQQVLDEVEQLVGKHESEELSITVIGHSLGAALATLCAYDIPNTSAAVQAAGATVSAFVYAPPKVGGSDFVEKANKLAKILRIVDRRDIVPILPPLPFYTHAGFEFMIDGSLSTYLKFSYFWELGKPHNLEGYLHTVAGFQKYVTPPSVVSQIPVVGKPASSILSLGSKFITTTTKTVVAGVSTVGTVVSNVLPLDQVVSSILGDNAEGNAVYNKLLTLFAEDPGALTEFLKRVVDITPQNMGTGGLFNLEVERDIALVNKGGDLLKAEYSIPTAWWVLPRKGMEQVGDTNVWHPRHQRIKDTPSNNPDFL